MEERDRKTMANARYVECERAAEAARSQQWADRSAKRAELRAERRREQEARGRRRTLQLTSPALPSLRRPGAAGRQAQARGAGTTPQRGCAAHPVASESRRPAHRWRACATAARRRGRC